MHQNLTLAEISEEDGWRGLLYEDKGDKYIQNMVYRERRLSAFVQGSYFFIWMTPNLLLLLPSISKCELLLRGLLPHQTMPSAPPISLKSECCKWESRKAHRTDILDYCHRAKCCRKRSTSSLHQVWFASCNNLTSMLFLASLKQTINKVKDGRSCVIEISSHCVSNHLHISNWAFQKL